MTRNNSSWEDCLPLRGKWLVRLIVALMLVPQIIAIVLTFIGYMTH